jgi:hypothetical protein
VKPDPLWRPAREWALTRDAGRCVICGDVADEVNHRVPRQMGGRNADPTRHAIAKLVSTCRGCHDTYERHDRAEGYRLGFFVPVGSRPSGWPVLYRGRWALLTDIGTIDYLPPYHGALGTSHPLG